MRFSTQSYRIYSSVVLLFAVVTFGQDAYTVNESEDVTIRVLVTSALISSFQIGIFTSQQQHTAPSTAGFAISTYTAVI